MFQNIDFCKEINGKLYKIQDFFSVVEKKGLPKLSVLDWAGKRNTQSRNITLKHCG